MAQVALNTQFLKSFIRDQIEPFADSVDKMLKDDATAGPAMSTIAKKTPENTTVSTTSRPLVIGNLAGEKSATGGADLNKVIYGAAKELERIFDEQSVLFEDLKEAMEDTIEKLNTTQKQNLESITPEDFLDIFEDVDSDLQGGDGQEEEEGD